MSRLANSSPINSDKLGFFFCLAAALHAAVILGIGFTEELRKQSAPRLEITLAKHKSINTEEADFLAQNDQAGSGTLDEKALLTTDKLRPLRDSVHSTPETLSLAKRQLVADGHKVLSTNSQAQNQAVKVDKKQEQTPEPVDGHADTTQLSREIASLQAKLAIQRQAYAKRPRIRTLSSTSTKAAIEAQYLNQWRTEIETIGNNNYPEQARRKGIEGSLRLMVALFPDGSIRNVEILQKSGYPLLDAAALRIVLLAAPFPPFPVELRKKVDVLEIIRTWRFEQSILTSES